VIGVLNTYFIIKGYRNSVHHAGKASITKEEHKAKIKNAVSEIKILIKDLEASVT
jgi:hypothetical protein